MEVEKSGSTYAALRAINVNDKIEKKGNLSYLSWAWAVDQLLLADPAAAWDYRWFGDLPYCAMGNTAMVFCTVRAFGVERTAQLPIMDSRNKSIPVDALNSFIVNTSMQRALAKAIALHGIGLYIYAGEDLPDTPQQGAEDGVPDALLDAARDAANEGVEPFKLFWKQSSDHDRRLLIGELQSLRAAALAVPE